MEVILIIVTIAVLVFVISAVLGAEKLSRNCVTCFTGGLGCGKTYMAVSNAVKKYRSAKTVWRIKCFFVKTFNHFRINKKQLPEKPLLFSNIPIRYGKDQWSSKLLREHLLLKNRIPLKSVVLIDEVGQVASQWDFDNPLVLEEFQEFVRLFRHYVDGYLFVTDQASSNIVKQLRCRLNIIYNLDNFRRLFFVLPFFKVDVNVLKVSEETLLNTNTVRNNKEGFLLTKKLSNDPYFLGYLPYKFQKSKKLYDSRCYSNMYDCVFSLDKNHCGFKCDYFISLDCSPAERKAYKNRKK